MTREQLELYYPTSIRSNRDFFAALLDSAQKRLPSITAATIQEQIVRSDAASGNLVYADQARSMKAPALWPVAEGEAKTRLIRVWTDRKDGLSYVHNRIRSNRTKHRGHSTPVEWGKEGMTDYLSSIHQPKSLLFRGICIRKSSQRKQHTLERGVYLELDAEEESGQFLYEAQAVCLRGLKNIRSRDATIDAPAITCKIADIDQRNSTSANISEFLHDMWDRLPVKLAVGGIALDYSSRSAD
jgi:hypothetical protein